MTKRPIVESKIPRQKTCSECRPHMTNGRAARLARNSAWGGIKRAMIFGSVIASFAVESFSVQGLLEMNRAAIHQRYEVLRQCTMFEALTADRNKETTKL